MPNLPQHQSRSGGTVRGFASDFRKKSPALVGGGLHSKKFQLGWGIWILILGITLLFAHTLQHVGSFSEYLHAFLILDMPSSWCPTFLILYGLSSIAGYLIGGVFTPFTGLAGLVLLPVGLYATYEFTFQPANDPLPIYIYAQTIHISEILTGPLTVFLLVKQERLK